MVEFCEEEDGTGGDDVEEDEEEAASWTLWPQSQRGICAKAMAILWAIFRDRGMQFGF